MCFDIICQDNDVLNYTLAGHLINILYTGKLFQAGFQISFKYLNIFNESADQDL